MTDPSSRAVHDVRVPAADEGADKPWRKALRSLDPNVEGARAVHGPWLAPEAVVRLPVGTLVVGCDRTGADHHRTRLWRVDTDGALLVEYDTVFKTHSAAFGARVRRVLTKALSAHPCPLFSDAVLAASEPTTLRANKFDGTCLRCHGPVPARTGVLVGYGKHARVAHDGDCPTPPAAPAAPIPARPAEHADASQARRNRKPGSCSRCMQIVPADQGVLSGFPGAYTAAHDGDCPPYPGGYDGPTWTISAGEHGQFRHRPGRYWDIGQVLRAQVYSRENPVPAHVPGRREINEWTTGMFAVVLAEADPTYYWDEDGNNPSELIGEDGWLFRATVRPATVEEAAPLLAADALAARRRDLAQRCKDAFALGRYASDGEVPDEVDLTGATPVPFGSEVNSPSRTWPHDRLLVDESAGVVWSLAYNGLDGDDWSRNNTPRYIARRQPLTPQRAEVITALRAEYELPTWKVEAGVSEAAAVVLVEAGWHYEQARAELGCLQLFTTEDARAFLARPLAQWQKDGWIGWGTIGDGDRVAPAEAARLADAGITHQVAADLRRAGHTDADAMLDAAAPAVPDQPGRFILRPPARSGWSVKVTTDPELARAWLRARPTYWWDGAVEHTPGIAPVHVAGRDSYADVGLGDGWVLWDDGSLLCRAEWLEIWHTDPDKRRRAPAPTGLTAAAAHAVGLIACAANDAAKPRPIWHPLRTAVAHSKISLASDEHDSGSWTSAKELIRHDYQLADGTEASLWQLHASEGGIVNGEGDYAAHSHIWPGEQDARSAYTQHRLR